MKKILRIVLSSVGVLVLVLVIGVTVFGGSIIRGTINSAGPGLLGVPVTLQDAKFSPLQGRLRLTGLHVGNPEGFKTPGLFDVGIIEVKLDTASLLSDTIVIEKILVDAPEITFERGLRKSNLGALLEGMGGKTGAPGQPAQETAESQPGKKVVIDDLQVTGGKVKLSVTAAQGLATSVVLEPIHLTGLGREEGAKGLGVSSIIQIVLGTVLRSVTTAVGDAGALAVDGVKAVGGVAIDGVGTVGGAAVKGVGAVGGVAAEGVKTVGEGLGKALGGLLGNRHAATNAPASR